MCSLVRQRGLALRQQPIRHRGASAWGSNRQALAGHQMHVSPVGPAIDAAGDAPSGPTQARGMFEQQMSAACGRVLSGQGKPRAVRVKPRQALGININHRKAARCAGWHPDQRPAGMSPRHALRCGSLAQSVATYRPCKEDREVGEADHASALGGSGSPIVPSRAVPKRIEQLQRRVSAHRLLGTVLRHALKGEEDHHPALSQLVGLPSQRFV